MWAILVAAGTGSRMRAELPKQYLPLAGKTLLERSLRILESAESVSGIVVVLAADDCHWHALDLKTSKPLHTVTGGAERADSVLAGLQFLAAHCGKDDWVLIHDAARACLRPEKVDSIESALMGHECGGLLAIPMRDTLKRAADGQVAETLDRDQYWQAQTPQVFRYEMLTHALQTAQAKGIQVTDESMAMELAGHHPKLIEGQADNIKITVSEDIALAEYLLAKREGKAVG